MNANRFPELLQQMEELTERLARQLESISGAVGVSSASGTPVTIRYNTGNNTGSNAGAVTTTVRYSSGTTNITHTGGITSMEKPVFYTVSFNGLKYEFQFRYKETDGIYKAYIVNQPSYGDRSTSLNDTHRLTEGSSFYVCWSEPIRSEEDMNAVVALWCRATVMYICFGGDLKEHAEKILNAS